MMHARILLICFTISYLVGCTSGEESRAMHDPDQKSAIDSLHALQEEPNRKGTPTDTDTILFRSAFDRFLTALHSADTALVNQFVHPDLGVWIIEQPGAVPKMTRVTDIGSFRREYQNRSFFTLAQEVQECELLEEPFPGFDCGAMGENQTGYTKDGCFVWEPDRFRSSGYWNYASLTDTQLDQVKATLPLVQKSVLHTPTSFEFHFGYVNGQWQLLFAKLIYPCSA